MKFDCGESHLAKRKRLSDWHDFFALLPRRIGENDCRWLETIERKGRYYPGNCSPGWWIWEYRAKEKK